MNSPIQKLAEGLAIFQKYDGSHDVMAEHEIIYAGPDPETVSEEDLALLEAIGWVREDGLENFQLNV